MRLFDLQEDHVSRMNQLTNKFSDVPMDLADATLIIASEITGYREIASIDSEIYIYRDIRNNYLTNVFM